jgi:hypothetical protein
MSVTWNKAVPSSALGNVFSDSKHDACGDSERPHDHTGHGHLSGYVVVHVGVLQRLQNSVGASTPLLYNTLSFTRVVQYSPVADKIKEPKKMSVRLPDKMAPVEFFDLGCFLTRAKSLRKQLSPANNIKLIKRVLETLAHFTHRVPACDKCYITYIKGDKRMPVVWLQWERAKVMVSFYMSFKESTLNATHYQSNIMSGYIHAKYDFLTRRSCALLWELVWLATVKRMFIDPDSYHASAASDTAQAGSMFSQAQLSRHQ